MPLVVRQRACAAPDPSPQPVGRSQPSAERSARRDRRRAACHRPCPLRLARGARPRPPVPLGEGQACASPQFGAVDWREHAHGGVAPPAPAAVPRCVSAAAGGRVFFSFRPLSPSRGPAGGAQSRPRAPPGRRWMNGPRSTARTRAARPGNCLPLAGAFQSRPAPPPSFPPAPERAPLNLSPPSPLPSLSPDRVLRHRPPPPARRPRSPAAQAQTPGPVAQLLLHGCQVPGLLPDHDRVLALPDGRDVLVVLGDALPADGGQGPPDGGLLLPAQGRLRGEGGAPLFLCVVAAFLSVLLMGGWGAPGGHAELGVRVGACA